MIQRIQSLYLALAVISMCFALNAPLAEFTAGAVNVKMTALGYERFGQPTLPQPDHAIHLPWGILALTIVLIALSAYILLQYKNRIKQIMLCNVSVAVHVFYYITYIAYCYAFASREALHYSPGFYIILPVASLVFTLLARRGIKADEAKIRAADRIR